MQINKWGVTESTARVGLTQAHPNHENFNHKKLPFTIVTTAHVGKFMKILPQKNRATRYNHTLRF